MRVWLTGCNGMLAQALARQLTAARIECVGTDLEVDLSSEADVRSFCRNETFTHILNAAAYTRVDDAESEVDKAFSVNGTAVRLLTQVAEERRVTFVHFSTDYVFSGRASEPYSETSATAPASTYGKSKLDGEQWATNALTRAQAQVFLIRTSWLFGPGGNNFVRTILKAMIDRDEIRVVDDQWGRPTYTVDLAAAALALVGIDRARTSKPGIYHYANSGVVSWHEFTLTIAQIARNKGLRLKANEILPISSAEYKRPAPRPAYSVLDTTKLERALGETPRSYRVALSEYLDLLIPTLR